MERTGAVVVAISKSRSLSAISGDSSSATERTTSAKVVDAGVGLLAQLLDLGQRQHLVGEQVACSTVSLISSSAWLDVAMQRRLNLGLEHRRRRARLVRGVAHKAFLVVQQVQPSLITWFVASTSGSSRAARRVPRSASGLLRSWP
jgi:hypothetical protein